MVAVEGLRPGVHLALEATENALTGIAAGAVTRWRDVLDVPAALSVEARFADGHAAVVRHRRTRYASGWLDAAALDALMRQAVVDAGLPAEPLPSGLRLRRRGRLQFAIHYGAEPVDVPAPAGARFVLGGPRLQPAGVAAWWVDVS